MENWYLLVRHVLAFDEILVWWKTGIYLSDMCWRLMKSWSDGKLVFTCLTCVGVWWNPGRMENWYVFVRHMLAYDEILVWRKTGMYLSGICWHMMKSWSEGKLVCICQAYVGIWWNPGLKENWYVLVSVLVRHVLANDDILILSQHVISNVLHSLPLTLVFRHSQNLAPSLCKWLRTS